MLADFTPAAAGSISRSLSQLFPQVGDTHGSDSSYPFRCVFGRFTFVPLLNSHLLTSSANFTAVAHHHDLLNRSSTGWFEASFCTPAPRGLPSSSTTALKARSLRLPFASHSPKGTLSAHSRHLPILFRHAAAELGQVIANELGDVGRCQADATTCSGTPAFGESLRGPVHDLGRSEAGENVRAELDLGVVPGFGADLEMLDIVGDGVRD